MFLDNKGQASAEFIFITLIVIIVIGGFVGIIGSNQDKTQTGDTGGARVLGEKIAETINTVYINGNGYSIDLDLRTLNQAMSSSSTPFTFNATVSNSSGKGFVTVSSGGNNVNVDVIPNKINGTPINLDNTHIYKVKNVNGIIQIILI